jgi:TolB protein
VRLLLALMFALAAVCAQAQLTIEITEGVDNPTPIAIVPFGNAGGLPEDLQQIVAADLQRSGLFRPIPPQDMLSFPRSQTDLHYRDWRVLGASYVVIGSLSQTEQGYTLRYELYDVLSQNRLLSRTVSGGSQSLRDMAHRVSDAVFEAITGIKGIFSTKLLYVEDLGRPGEGRYRLMQADADGARTQLVFASSQPILSPAWSNDMTQVAYVSFETTRPAIFRQNLVTGAREQLTDFRGLNGAPSWSPDDQKMAMVLSKDGNPEIYVLDLASKRLTRVTNHFAIDTEPNWTADGKSIIFTSNRGASPQIYQVGLANGRVERLTFEGNYNARARISPDGKSIVMIHRQSDTFHIAWQDLATGNMRILTETWLDESPSIAPNGAMLIYATQHDNKGVLAVVSMDAGVKFRLPSQQGDVREPSWSPFVN